jgi:hypothetical protein
LAQVQVTFLEAMYHFLPNQDITFVGVEKYPLKVEQRSRNKGFVQGWLDLFEEEEFA